MVWKLFIHICLGVEHMHFKNYIHRDLKTQNIFLTRDNIARVGDLGLALKIEASSKDDGNLLKIENMQIKDEEFKESETKQISAE